MPLLFSGISIWSLILLVMGIGFLVAEIFHPGFGLPGVLGIVCLGLDILVSAKTFAQGLLMTAIAAVIVLVILAVGASLISHGKLPKKLVLREENGAEEGFVSAENGAEVGDVGRAATVLRPAGIAEIGGKRLDVVTRGEFLPEGAALKVLAAEGGRIVVGPAEEPEEPEEKAGE